MKKFSELLPENKDNIPSHPELGPLDGHDWLKSQFKPMRSWGANDIETILRHFRAKYVREFGTDKGFDRIILELIISGASIRDF